jgi:hypothetical protein
MKPNRLLLAASLLGAGLFLAGCDRGPPDASDYSRRLQSLVGRGFGPVSVASVHADANVLVVTFDGPANWRLGYPSFMFMAVFLDGFCQTAAAKNYFHDGRTLRIDTREAGRKPITGTPVSRCRDR